MRKRKGSGEGGLVYSSDQGAMCPSCSQPVDACRCSDAPATPKGDGIVRVSRETKGRKGKGVTLVTGVPLTGADLTKLAKDLKKKCGSGGALKNGVIESHGDHRDLLVTELEKRGYRVKRAGG